MIFGKFLKSNKKQLKKAAPSDEVRQPTEAEGQGYDDPIDAVLSPPLDTQENVTGQRTGRKSKITKENTALSGKRRVKRAVHTKKSFHPKRGRSATEQVRIYDAIIRPVLTEKSAQMSEEGVYTFLVRKWATKHIVADAIEAIYNVRPVRVRVAKRPSKRKRIRVSGREHEYTHTKSRKKVYVFLKKGDTIQLTQ